MHWQRENVGGLDLVVRITVKRTLMEVNVRRIELTWLSK
jgi:hypothetical protein